MARTTKESLSNGELNEVLQFAEGLYNGYKGYGYATPFTQNQNLIDLTNVPTDVPTLDKITEALSHIVTSSEELRGYSEFLSVFDTIYGKTIDYLGNILAFDLSMTCKNIKNPSDYNSEAYKQDLKRVYKFLDSFDYKQEFRKVVKIILKTGVSFNSFRDSEGTYNEDNDALEIEKLRNFALQILPQKECLITGYFDKGSPLFDFNMGYFDTNNVDINLFDPWFIEKYAKLWENQNYNPSKQLNYRDGKFMDYVQTSPINGFWCFKWDLDNFNIVPPLASLMKSVINNDTVVKLQTDKNMISAYLLLAGEIATMDGLKSGDKANQTKFSAKVLGEFMNLVTSGLKKNVKAVAMPLENIRGWQYNDENPNMCNTQFQTTASQGVSASPLIYANGNMAQSTIQNAIISDYNTMSKLYSQFANFLEFYINRKTKKYKFAFTFSGSNYPFEREYRRKSINELATLGLTLNSSAWASVYGYAPQEFDRMLEEAHYGGLSDKLTMLMNKNTMQGVGITENTQKKDETELTDKGEETYTYK